MSGHTSKIIIGKRILVMDQSYILCYYKIHFEITLNLFCNMHISSESVIA